MKIKVPEKMITERKYAIEVLLNNLDIDYEIVITKKNKEYTYIEYEEKYIRINNYFFEKLNDYGYTDKILPAQISNINISSAYNEIIGLYGTSTVKFDQNNICIDNDLLGSLFFMTTRFEEYVCKKKDTLGRFSHKDSFAYKNNFMQRPIVDEYIKLIADFFNLKYKKNFSITYTHDMDILRKYPSNTSYIKRGLSSLIKHKNIENFMETYNDFINMKFKRYNDPYDTFQYLIEQEKLISNNIIFFIMTGGTSKLDNFYKIEDKVFKNIYHELSTYQNVEFGLHPSFNTMNDYNQLAEEFNKLDNFKHSNISRQHYLRLSVPETLINLDKIGIAKDYSFNYSRCPGFRCGTSHSFYYFDFINRKKLNLEIQPTQIMDVNFEDYSKEEALNIIDKIIYEVKKHHGNLVILWHNSSFNTQKWKEKEYIYKYINNNVRCHLNEADI